MHMMRPKGWRIGCHESPLANVRPSFSLQTIEGERERVINCNGKMQLRSIPWRSLVVSSESVSAKSTIYNY